VSEREGRVSWSNFLLGASKVFEIMPRNSVGKVYHDSTDRKWYILLYSTNTDRQTVIRQRNRWNAHLFSDFGLIIATE
jgi:hypothetical protein